MNNRDNRGHALIPPLRIRDRPPDSTPHIPSLASPMLGNGFIQPYACGMPIPRKHLIDDSASGCFHCISRCVRRAFLCGDAAEHRREWVRERIRSAAAAFAVDVLAYAVMGNHLHLVVRTDPERAATWSATDIAWRWAIAHPRLNHDGHPSTTLRRFFRNDYVVFPAHVAAESPQFDITRDLSLSGVELL